MSPRTIVFNTEGPFIAPPLRTVLGLGNGDAVEASNERELLALARETAPHLIAIQAVMQPGPALEIAHSIRSMAPLVSLLLVTRRCSSELAIAAMRAGFNDVLADGCTKADVSEALARAARGPAPRTPVPLVSGGQLVGHSQAAENLRHAIRRVAATDSNVLITGETGTGKELTAELIHGNSRRRDKPLVSINCAAIPDGLLESELFGFERGAFTGAHAAREGKLQYAQGGTLFLDEVGDMNLYAQSKILRAIESRKVQRLGGHRDIAVNIRIIAATNQNVEQLTSRQKFRQDLYFRLNVARIHLPPLREHPEDIPELAEHLLAELARRLDSRVHAMDPSFVESLMRHEWPGNVRELRNVIEAALVFCESDRVTARDLAPSLRALLARSEPRQEADRGRIVEALRATGSNRKETARRLGCSRMTLYRKMVKYDLFPAGDSGAGDEAGDERNVPGEEHPRVLHGEERVT